MDLQEIIDALRHNIGEFPREALEEAVRRREEITPHLIQWIEEVEADPDAAIGDEARFDYEVALYFLAQFREPAAHEAIVRLCRMPKNAANILLDDLMTEAMPCILAETCGGALDSIKSLIEDPNVNEWIRDAALRALVILVAQEQTPRAEVVEYFRSLFPKARNEDKPVLVEHLATASRDIHPAGLEREIREALEDGLVPPFAMDLKSLDESLGMTVSAALNRAMREYGAPLGDVVNRLEKWNWSLEDTEDDEDDWEEDVWDTGSEGGDGGPIRKPPKTGRNEPCPCGSGKKYKKCCLNHDFA